MKGLIFIVIALVLADSSPQIELIEKLSQNSFGKQVLQTIQLELTQENAVNRIYTLLNQLFYDLRQEDATAAKANGERQSQCADQLAGIQAVQEKALVAIADYSRQVPARQEELEDKRNQLEQKTLEIERNSQLIINFVAQRRQEHEEYEQKRSELVSLINGLKQAAGIIRQLQSSHPAGALVELRQHHENLMKQYAGRSEFRKIASILMELCADAKIHADNDSVQVILDIIDDLIESIFEVQKKEMYAEDWAEKFFQEDLKRLQIENTRLVNSNAQDEAYVEYLNQRLEELNNSISIQQMIYDNKDIEKVSFQVSCKEDDYAAQVQKGNRDEQIQIILQLLELFENHFNDQIRTVLLDLFA
ncbi:hypothetical protein pb186bvf_010865 [Paramecium bursaria]